MPLAMFVKGKNSSLLEGLNLFLAIVACARFAFLVDCCFCGFKAILVCYLLRLLLCEFNEILFLVVLLGCCFVGFIQS